MVSNKCFRNELLDITKIPYVFGMYVCMYAIMPILHTLGVFGRHY